MPAEPAAAPTSQHFALHTLANGVYAAIGLDSGGGYSNAGIIDLGDRTLIFDTFNTVQAAQDLRVAAEALTGRPTGLVVISHAHTDHWMGNQVFADHAPILTTAAIRAAMAERAAYLQELQADPSLYEAEVQQARERLQDEPDPRWRAGLELFLKRAHHVCASLEVLALTVPTVTFEGSLAFHGPQRRVELRVVAPGHTDSDVYLLLPEERIAFLGDLGFFGCQPFMAYCDPAAWTAALEALEASDLDTLVPGHGPVGTPSDMARLRLYLAVVDGLVARIVAEGGSVEDALQQPLPPPFDAWLHGGMGRFEDNVQSAYERLSSAA